MWFLLAQAWMASRSWMLPPIAPCARWSWAISAGDRGCVVLRGAVLRHAAGGAERKEPLHEAMQVAEPGQQLGAVREDAGGCGGASAHAAGRASSARLSLHASAVLTSKRATSLTLVLRARAGRRFHHSQRAGHADLLLHAVSRLPRFCLWYHWLLQGTIPANRVSIALWQVG